MRTFAITLMLVLAACSDFDKGDTTALLRVVRISKCEITVSGHVDRTTPFKARILSNECKEWSE